MDNLLAQQADLYRLGFFIGIFVIMALWEVFAPRRPLTVAKSKRWVSNLGIIVLNSLIVRLLVPSLLVIVAVFAQEQQWGILHYFQAPYWLGIILAVIVLDFAIYLQHVMFHALPLLWRIHRMHHLDLDIDVTTGLRFHPVEIILSLFIKTAVILLLGAVPLAVVIFEIILNGTSMFNHSNIKLPGPIDRVIRWFIVTPDMHRVHHSVIVNETNSNFGFNFSIWDRLMGTYRAQPKLGHQKMTIGIDEFRDHKDCVSLWGMLVSPLKGKKSHYPINRKD